MIEDPRADLGSAPRSGPRSGPRSVPRSNHKKDMVTDPVEVPSSSSSDNIETGEEKPVVHNVPSFMVTSPSTGKLHPGQAKAEGVYRSV